MFLTGNTHSHGQNRRGLIVSALEKAKRFQQKMPDSSAYYAKIAFQLAFAERDYWIMSKAKAIEGRVKNNDGKDLESIFDYLDALDYLSSADTTDSFLAYTVFKNIAVVQHNFGLYASASSHYDSALLYLREHIATHPAIASRYNDHLLIYSNRYFKGINEYESGNVEDALNILIDLLQDSRTPNSIRWNTTNKIGLILSEMGQETQSIKSFESIIDDPDVDSLTRSRAWHNIGSLYFKLGKFDKSLFYYSKSVNYSHRLPNKELLFFDYLDLGETYLELGNDKRALDYLNRALDIGVSLESDPRKYRVYQLIGLALVESQPTAAKIQWKRYSALDEEYEKGKSKLSLLNKQRELTLALESYFEKREHNREIQEYKSSYGKNKLSIMLVSLIILYSVVLFIRKKDRNKRKKFHQQMLQTGNPD